MLFELLDEQQHAPPYLDFSVVVEVSFPADESSRRDKIRHHLGLVALPLKYYGPVERRAAPLHQLCILLSN